MSGHASDAELTALVEGRLNATQAIHLREHTFDCDECGNRLEALEHQAPPQQTDRLGRYVLIDVLGEGGMGRVMRAYDPQLDRRCALKLVRPDLATTDAAARLVREAQAMAKVQHPNIVSVFDAGEVDGRFYVAMELVEGPTLADWLKEPRPWREVVRHFIEAGRGLHAAHQAGLVHRDFKPANVLLREGSAKVTDFGLARAAAAPLDPSGPIDVPADGTMTLPGLVMGTPAYMAPEQRDGISDARSDQYAFGVSLFEGLHGHRPRDGKALRAIPRWLEAVTRRLLEAEPARRFGSMAEVVEALERGITARQTRLYASVASAVLLVSFSAFAVQRAQKNARCDGATSGLSETFAPEKIRAHFAGQPWASTAFARIEPHLAKWSDAWSQARSHSCQASLINGQLSDQLYTLQSLCLDRRLNQFGAVVEAMAKLPLDEEAAAVKRLEGLDQQIPSIEPCANLEALVKKTSAESEVQQREALPVRRRIDDALAMSASGLDTQALTLAREVSTSVEKSDNTVLRAEALSLTGQLEVRAGRSDDARPLLLDAFELAASVGEDEIALRAWMIAMPLTVTDEPSLALARTVAEAEMNRVGRTPELEASLAYRIGRVRFMRGDYKRAIADFTHALELRRTVFGDDHPDTLLAANNVSATLTRLGQYDDALKLQGQIAEAIERTHGPDSILTSEARSDYGAQLVAAHYDAEGKKYLDAALERFDREGSSNKLTLFSTIDNLAFAEMRLGDLKRARVLRDRLVTLSEEKFGLTTYLGDAYAWRAELGLREGNAAAALADAKMATEKLSAIAKDHSELPWSLAYLAEAATALNDQATAKEALARANTLITAEVDEVGAQVRFAESCALRPSPEAETKGAQAAAWFAAQPRMEAMAALARRRADTARTPWRPGEKKCSW